MIRTTDRVANVLARDERLVEVFASASPVFERLRNPGLRRVMAPLVTIEQAARIARIDASQLVEQLNHALTVEPSGLNETGAAAGSSGGRAQDPEPARSMGDEELPPQLASLPEESILDLDVRAELRAGREPFRQIMEARRRISPGGALRLRALFEPVPLYAVMAKQGLEHWTVYLADDDWQVWFYASESAPTRRVPSSGAAADETFAAADAGTTTGDQPSTVEDPQVVVLDVRDLEPPVPMLLTLAALEKLPRGKTLVQVNVRVPQHLLPRLEALGFSYELRQQSADVVRVFIRHRDA